MDNFAEKWFGVWTMLDWDCRENREQKMSDGMDENCNLNIQVLGVGTMSYAALMQEQAILPIQLLE